MLSKSTNKLVYKKAEEIRKLNQKHIKIANFEKINFVFCISLLKT